ncbi:cation-translocating P-type ATPase [Clostridium kluyveri]
MEGPLRLIPDKAKRIKKSDNNSLAEEIVDVSTLRIGDMIRILPGEIIVADGEIISGETSVNQSVLTGESLPVDKFVGDVVFTGTLNCFGSIDVAVTKTLQNSSLKKMVLLAKEAENKQAPMQKIVDKWAQCLVPIACLIAIVGYFITKDLIKAVTILVVFCPCALALATPVSIVAAIGQATKFGVVIKSGEALEKMGKVSVVAFDKTGTLTKGILEVSDIISFNIEENKLLSLAASCESHSEHPIGKAITSYVREKKIPTHRVSNFVMSIGKGVHGIVQEKLILCGNEKLLEDFHVSYEDSLKLTLNEFYSQGKAVVIIAGDYKVIGFIALSDVLKENVKEAIYSLHSAGIHRTILLTGDNKNAAEYIAKKSGITEVNSSLLPEDKVSIISQIENEGDYICMIGDGINDAAALKTSSIGMAMGTMGSDIAIDAADIALMGDDIVKTAYVKRLSNAIIYNIKINISISMIINVIAITLSLLGILNPITGALVHNIGSVLVVMNAARFARLYDKKV